MTVRVLLVDDTDHVRQMLVHLMTLQGFEVVGESASGAEALEVAGETRPDIVVLDYKMPRMNGLEAARRFREQHPDTPVILYSAFLSEEIQEQAEDAGVAVCIPKAEGVEALGREIAALALSLDEGE